jgi:hypothetical protein
MELMGPSRPSNRKSASELASLVLTRRHSRDSLVFVPSFMAFACCQAGLQGLPVPPVPIQSGEIIRTSLLHLHLSFRVWPLPSWLCGSSVSAGHQCLLLWDSHRPAADISHLASTPTRPESLASSSGNHAVRLFRPRGFSPPRRFPPRASRESIAPHNRLEVRCVSLGSVRVPYRSTYRMGSRPPRSAISHPSKDSPRRQPHRVTTAVAFLAFHSLRALTHASMKRLASPVFATSEEMTQPTPIGAVARIMTTAVSEEATLDMSPTLRRLPNQTITTHRRSDEPFMAAVLRFPRKSTFRFRPASLPRECRKPSNQSTREAGSDTDNAPAHRSAHPHHRDLPGALQAEASVAPGSLTAIPVRLSQATDVPFCPPKKTTLRYGMSC